MCPDIHFKRSDLGLGLFWVAHHFQATFFYIEMKMKNSDHLEMCLCVHLPCLLLDDEAKVLEKGKWRKYKKNYLEVERGGAIVNLVDHILNLQSSRCQ